MRDDNLPVKQTEASMSDASDPKSERSKEGLAFARNFKEHRKKLGLSMQDIEALTGISDSFVSMMERGERSITIDNMAKLAAAVGKSVKQLLS